MSQAIYLAFYLTFDDSRHELNDEFKQELCNVIGEWVLGVRPIPESYKHWEINDEINLNSLIELKAASNAQSKLTFIRKRKTETCVDFASTLSINENKQLGKDDPESGRT